MTKFAIVGKPTEKSERLMTKIRAELLRGGFSEDEEKPEIVIVVGGDGSFLHAVHRYLERLDEVALIGLHSGTLGFFMDYRDSEVDDLIADLKGGELAMQTYPLLEAAVGERKFYAVNEVRVENIVKTQRLEVFLDGEKFEDFRGTGLLVATQLGSSAYNRALGGAVLQKGLPALELTEIAGIHHRDYRSLGVPFVLSDRTEIELRSDDFTGAYLGFDSEIVSLDGESVVKITKSSEKQVRVFRAKKIPYFERLRQLF